MKSIVREMVSPEQLKVIRRVLRPAWLGSLRRTSPLSRRWGFDRGTPVDRYYIETFLSANKSNIGGHVLEVKDSTYTKKFGNDVTRADVLDVDASNSRATILCDLAETDKLPDSTFDCFILVQTLQFIYEMKQAVAGSWRVLKPGGVLLVTVPFISKVANGPGECDQWRFTAETCQRLFGGQFGVANTAVSTYGNVLTAIAFLTGMACEELSTQELDHSDHEYPVIVAVRAVK